MDEIVEAFAGLRAMFTRLRLQRLRIPLGGALQRFFILQRNSPFCNEKAEQSLRREVLR